MAQNNFSESPFEKTDHNQKTDNSFKDNAFDPVGLLSEAKDIFRGSSQTLSRDKMATESTLLADNRILPSLRAVEKSEKAKAPETVADKVIDKLKDKPLENIQSALKKLDNLDSATVTRNGKTSHIDINLLHGQTVAPPNVQVRGFIPVASHIAPHLSFDMTAANGGMHISNMQGFSASVQGPLGRLRHSETTSMFIGKDAAGSFVSSSSDLYMRRRVHSSTTVLRENNFPADSPMRSAMQHPEALDQIGGMMRMFQKTDDQLKMSMKKSGNSFDLKSEAGAEKHIDLDFKPENVPIPVMVRSMDLDKTLSASLNQSKDSVGLSKIAGLKVNVEIAGLKASLNPISVSLEKDCVKLELKNPADGSILPVSIPVSKLREAAAKK